MTDDLDIGAELVDEVDEDDRVVRRVTRRVMRRSVLLHRVVSVLCMNSRREIFVHRRTPNKDLFPNLYDPFIAGTVESGESYESSAERELAEEIGVRGAALERLFHYRYEGRETRSHIECFRVIWDGPVTLQATEIAWGEFRPLLSLIENKEGFEFVPDGAELFARYIQAHRSDHETR
jgi:8-oxo-dGTP pyrophosphatase MutT (NUDIX family)